MKFEKMMLTYMTTILTLSLLDQIRDVVGAENCSSFSESQPIDVYNTSKSQNRELLISLSTCLEIDDKMDPNGFYFKPPTTGLMLAAKEGLTEIAIHFVHILHGKNIDVQNNHGFTAALVAAEFGSLDILKILLALNANIDHKLSDRDTALILASGGGHAPVVKTLLKRGADVNGRGDWDDTALIRAAEKNHASVIDVLLEYNANVNSSNQWGDTALTKAAEKGDLGMVQALVYKGADVKASNSNGYTPLKFAARAGKANIVEFLLKKGLCSQNDIDSSLVVAAGAEVVNLLLKYNANVRYIDEYGRTALLIAVNSGDLDVVQTLVRKGADVNIATKPDGETPLSRAAFDKAELDMIKFLLENGANRTINYLAAGMTALDWAMFSDSCAIAKLIKSYGGVFNREEEEKEYKRKCQ